MNLRQEISQALGFTITPGQWERDFDRLEKDGRLTQSKLIEIILILIRKLEALENE